MGLIVSVYRNPSMDSAINSPLRDHWRVCAVNVDGPFNFTCGYPPVMLVERFGHPIIVPAVKDFDHWVPQHGMHGGGFVGTSDARFIRAVEQIVGGPYYGAVPLHDRFEQGWVA